MTSLAQDPTGNQLVEFLIAEELTIFPDEQHIPLAFTMVIARCEGKIMLVFNRTRQKWEFPGGGFETGESAIDCARREFFEETNQQLTAIHFRARVKLYLSPKKQYQESGPVFAAMFLADVDTLVPFVPNNEMDRLILWDRQTPLEGYFNPIDLKLLELALAE